MERNENYIAVISGDIVKSTKLSTEEYSDLLKRIKAIQDLISKDYNGNSSVILRGDEFQFIVLNPEKSLIYALIIKVAIKALGKQFDSRISFAIGQGADLGESIHESMGEAFTLSGRRLKEMKSERFVFTAAGSIAISQEFQLLFQYLDKQLSDLSTRQCEVLLPVLQAGRTPSLKDLSEKLDVTGPTISVSLKTSGYHLMNELNMLFVDKFKGLNDD
ncbi:hypothetical protein [Vibrio sp. EA2]|uniref:hypothetical protein n=1 Tax=Vibrio sp. EA2 TaxID=3079860 RepID=UPI00294A7104|nr:hypothetical protein [Vibrio sp. EA2]MDV6251085.1 hypothetical protein [Vibrio sp. EA2]